MARSKTAAIDLPSYPTGNALIEAEAGRIFLNLESMSSLQVGYMFGLDRYYTSEGSIRTSVGRAVNLVLQNPEKYDITLDKAGYIQGIIHSRSIVKKSPETLREEQEIKAIDIGSAVVDARDRAAKLVRKKLEYYETNRKAFKELSLKELIGAFHILFDKGQIIQGAATEHVAIMSNIPEKMDPAEAMAAIMKMREMFQEQKK